MQMISADFHAKLAEEKIKGKQSAKEFADKFGLDAAKRAASASVLSNEEARKDYGFWHGWIDACLEYRA